MQRLPVRHSDLYAATKSGVNVRVPLGTRKLHLCATPGAIPVEVFAGALATVGEIADGIYNHEAGVVLNPGGTLVLDGPGVSFFTVRPLPGLNSGFTGAAYVSMERELDRGVTDWTTASQNTEGFGVSDVTWLGVGVAQLVFLTDAVVQGGEQYMPGSLRAACISWTDGTVTRPAWSWQLGPGSAGGVDAPIVYMRLPHGLLPLEVVRRFTRARLHVRVGSAYLAASAVQRAALLTAAGLDGFHEGLLLGAFRKLTTAGAQDYLAGSSEVWIDYGTPSELCSAFTAYKGMGTLQRLSAGATPNTYGASIAAEWILDNAPSERGRIVGRAMLDVTALTTGLTESVMCYVRDAALVRVLVTTAATGAEVRAWRQTKLDAVSGDTSVTPDFSAPLPAALPGATAVVHMPLGPGNWMVGIYSGTSGTLTAKVAVTEA